MGGRVGLGKSSLFHHFKSKADLYLAVLRRVFDRIDESVAPVDVKATLERTGQSGQVLETWSTLKFSATCSSP